MLTRSKTSSTCTTHVADNMEIIYNVVILFFFPSIVMIRSINKTMDNNKTHGWIKTFPVTQ